MRTARIKRRRSRSRTEGRERLDPIVRRFLVYGKVQGVFFRHSTRLEAAKLSIKGFARNLPDGSVEVLAQGSATAVEQLSRWLARGPAGARVDEVRETSPDADEPIPAGFEVF